jgi:hypothetical protein
MTPHRDPRNDPQPGDELRGRGSIFRRILKREGERLLIQRWGQRYWIPVKIWQKWCEQSGAEIATTSNQEK